MLLIYGAFQDYWNLYHKVTFDGENKLIIVNPDEGRISVKIDIYSDWKEWSQIYDYTKYPQALRTTGGDPIGGGQYTGDVYFLMNGWRIYMDHSVNFDGVIYTEEGDSPFVVPDNVFLSTNKVSNLVQTVVVSGNQYTLNEIGNAVRVELTPELDYVDVAVSSRASATSVSSLQTNMDALQVSVNNLPTAPEIAAGVRVELTAELAHLMALQNGLTEGQATMLLESYRLLGLDPLRPLVVTKTQRTAGAEISQSIAGDSNTTVVTRI